LIRLERTDTVVILGKRGIGKTTLARALIMQNPGLRYLIVDVIGNYEDFKSKYEVLRISPVERSKFDMALIRAMDRGMFAVLDEVDRFQYDHILSYYVNIGRNYGSGWIAIARRPANLSKDSITNANYTFIAKTTQKRDVEFIRASYDIDADDLAALGEHEFYLFHHDDLIKKVKVKL
jgi:predicted AAA+ superfamily ATPase